MRVREKFFRGFCHAVVTLIADVRVASFVARVITASHVVIVGAELCARPHCETAAPVDDTAASGLLIAPQYASTTRWWSSRACRVIRVRTRGVCALTCTYV
jgi:hypothetical protein